MATTSRNARGPRLGTQSRGKLAAAYGQRGVGPNSLWYVYSPRGQSDWVLRSDLEWDHFVLTESDPTIMSCSSPQRSSSESYLDLYISGKSRECGFGHTRYGYINQL